MEPKPREQSAAQKNEPSAAAQKDAARSSSALEKRPAKPVPAGGADKAGKGDRRQGAEPGFQLPIDLAPEIFRAVATPLPVEGGDEPMSYKVIVFGMLERAKHFPEAALARRARGVAVIAFSLDGAGRVSSVSLLRSSGDADLDAESVAVVNRAAPFPAPPRGALSSFVAEIIFGAQQ